MRDLQVTYTSIIESYVKHFMERQNISEATAMEQYSQLKLSTGLVLPMDAVRYDVDENKVPGFIFEWVRYNSFRRGKFGDNISYKGYCAEPREKALINPEEIKYRIEEIVGVKDIAFRTNDREYVTWRQVAIHYTYLNTKASYNDLSSLYNKRTHATILNAKKKADIYLETEKKFRDLYKLITSQI